MNHKQEQHLDSLVENFVEDFIPKYEKGAIEHQGLLRDCSKEQLLDMALEEVLDLVSYLYTLKEKLCQK